VQSGKKSLVGFDFGTSTTLVSSPNTLIPIGQPRTWMPSVVGYGDDGSIVVGEAALDLQPEQVVVSIKRAITEGQDFVRVDTPTGPRDVRVDDLIAALLREARSRAETKGLDMSRSGTIRLGCPAMWDGRQRRRLVEAAKRAGLPVTLADLVDEPVAAGVAWLAGRTPSDAGPLRAVVFDMGGGTLDIAVLDVRGEGHRDVSVLAAISVAEAGDKLDEAIAEDLDFVLGAHGVDIDGLSDPERARARLRYAAREAKVALSTDVEHRVVLPRRMFGINEMTYTRDQLNTVFEPQMDRAEMYVATALRVARLAEEDPGTAYDIARTRIDELVAAVDVVVLSGGMSQIPYVEQRMREFFPATTVVERATDPTEHAVAVGLAKAGSYGRINMFRPGFDVLVEWDGGRQFRTIYEAYTPLVEAWQIAKGGADLRFIRTGGQLALPRSGTGTLRVVSYSDKPVRATLGGRDLDGFPVALSEQKFEFSIYPNGRIRLTDGSATYDGHVEDWHTVEPLEHGERRPQLVEQHQPDLPVDYPAGLDRG